MRPNPFTPTFGAPPPLLVGRLDLLDDLEDSLAEGPGSPGFATIYTGGRGVGKTVMLNAAEDLARSAGFAVISETATPGFVTRLVDHHLPTLLPAPRRRPTSGHATVLGTGAGLAVEGHDRAAPGLRELVEAVTLATPLFVSLDEVHRDCIDELRQLAMVIQHAVRERRPLAFCAAGLPSAINDVLADRVITFLRRADRHVLTALRVADVAAAFVEVVTGAGRTIDTQAAAFAAEATDGYPFMIQLVGYHSWRQHPDAVAITIDDVRQGADAARRRVGRLVFEPALADLSRVDRAFLMHMADDDGPSSMGQIATRMGVDANYASQYRLRLIAAGLIVATGHGYVDLAMPDMRAWLRRSLAGAGHPA